MVCKLQLPKSSLCQFRDLSASNHQLPDHSTYLGGYGLLWSEAGFIFRFNPLDANPNQQWPTRRMRTLHQWVYMGRYLQRGCEIGKSNCTRRSYSSHRRQLRANSKFMLKWRGTRNEHAIRIGSQWHSRHWIISTRLPQLRFACSHGTLLRVFHSAVLTHRCCVECSSHKSSGHAAHQRQRCGDQLAVC